jgi:hypothetical protein
MYLSSNLELDNKYLALYPTTSNNFTSLFYKFKTSSYLQANFSRFFFIKNHSKVTYFKNKQYKPTTYPNYSSFIKITQIRYIPCTFFFLEKKNDLILHKSFNDKPPTTPSLIKTVIPKRYTSIIGGLISASTLYDYKHSFDYNFLKLFDFVNARNLTKQTGLHYTGIFIIKHNAWYNYVSFKNFKYLYKLKKLNYSFTKPNYVKSIILKRKSSLVLYKLLSPIHFTNIFFKNCLQKINIPYWRNLINVFTYKMSVPLTEKREFTPTQDQILSEFSIRRVRFRPGYKRL